jgi:hypothetical protein
MGCEHQKRRPPGPLTHAIGIPPRIWTSDVAFSPVTYRGGAIQSASLGQIQPLLPVGGLPRGHMRPKEATPLSQQDFRVKNVLKGRLLTK